MRTAKLAIAAALAGDAVITRLVTCGQIFATERAVLPTLPAIELMGVSSAPQETGLVRHELSIEITVANVSEDGADERLSAIVAAVRRRLLAATLETDPIVLPSGAVAVVELMDTRWSTSAGGPSGVIRGASISMVVVGADE